MHAAWTLGLLLALPAEAGRRKDAALAGPIVIPAQGLSLRTAFDTDPSCYIERFLPDDLPGPVDETAAMPSACSRFITARTVDAGGVVYDEVFSASSEAAARAGGHAPPCSAPASTPPPGASRSSTAWPGSARSSSPTRST